MRKFSITDKLIIASLLISITTIFIVATFSFYRTKNTVINRTYNQLTSVRVIKANLLKQFFNNAILEMQLIKESHDIKSIVDQINTRKNTASFHLIKKPINHLNTFFFNSIEKRKYSRIFLIAKNKLVYYFPSSTDPPKISIKDYEDLWQNTLQSDSFYLSDYSIVNGKSYLHLSSKVVGADSSLTAIIVFEISSQPIDAIMLENNSSGGLGNTGESYLVGKDKLMRSSSRFYSNSILQTRVNTEASRWAPSQYSGSKILSDYRGIKVLSSFDKLNLPYLPWKIIAEIDFKEAMVPVYNIRNEIVFISIFIFLLVMLVVVIFSRVITYPIQKLNAAVHEIGMGNLDAKVNIIQNDEIGELAESFNTMATQLKEQSLKLQYEQQKSLSSLLDGQEIERQRISRELHDSLGQLLIGLKLRYENCILQSTKQNGKVDYSELGLLFDKTIDEARRISNNLMPAALSEFGLIPSIRNLCNDFSDLSAIPIQFSVIGRNNSKNNHKIAIYIYRIVQEAITNIIKHSDASKASITIEFTADYVSLAVRDNGKGFNVLEKRNSQGNGLSNIHDRVLVLKGSISMNSNKGEGSAIEIKIPLK